MKTILCKLLIGFMGSVLLLSSIACGSSTGNGDQTSDTLETIRTEASETAPQAETLPEDFVITEDGDIAHILTPQGLTYTVSGHDCLDKGSLSFTKPLTISFPEGSFTEAFNRFSITYKSTEPLKITVAYKVTKYDTTDEYFLEAGEGIFSGLPGSFMNEADCFSITTMTVEALTDDPTEFSLVNLTTEKIEVPNSSLYIENERFKLGVDLDWGGTINCIEDKQNPVSGLTNLVNKHDTGRLIQQSFYGTGPIEGVYQPGISFDAQWPYNPVQGGDQYNNPSRLIDLVITEDQIYIKSQPQDWSLDNQLTPSYMENTYTLKEDIIQVDNRFVDFSGWEHPYAGQELPALYTVSYLDTFMWYDGEASWTGDVLSSRDNLNFWGDAAYITDCTFPMKESNTETWCAWINTADNYGLGLYVPNIDRLKAGRYEYDGSMNARANSCNYVAPYNTIKLVSFEPLEYSYLLTAGSIEDIRETFTEHKDFTDNADLHENYISTRVPSVGGDVTHLTFDSPVSVNALSNPVSTAVTYDADEQAAKLTAGEAGDVSVTVNYGDYRNDLTADEYTILRIEYMIPTDNARGAYECDIFLCTGENANPTGDARLRERLVTDGEYHVLEIDLSEEPFWTGKIHKIRFDYFDASTAGDIMYIKSMTLE